MCKEEAKKSQKKPQRRYKLTWPKELDKKKNKKKQKLLGHSAKRDPIVRTRTTQARDSHYLQIPQPKRSGLIES